MNSVHLHLVLNHLPVMSVLFGTVLLLYGSSRKNITVLNIAFTTLAFAGMFAMLAYVTGLWANGAMDLEGARKIRANAHELAGELSAYATVLLGMTTYPVHLLHKEQKHSAKQWTLLMIFFAFVVLALMVWAAWSGGKIEH